MLRMAPQQPQTPEAAVPEPPATLAQPEDPPGSEPGSQPPGATGGSAPTLPLATPGWAPAASRRGPPSSGIANPAATAASGKAANEMLPPPVLSTDPVPAAAPATAPTVRQVSTDPVEPPPESPNVGLSAELSRATDKNAPVTNRIAVPHDSTSEPLSLDATPYPAGEPSRTSANDLAREQAPSSSQGVPSASPKASGSSTISSSPRLGARRQRSAHDAAPPAERAVATTPSGASPVAMLAPSLAPSPVVDPAAMPSEPSDGGDSSGRQKLEDAHTLQSPDEPPAQVPSIAPATRQAKDLQAPSPDGTRSEAAFARALAQIADARVTQLRVELGQGNSRRPLEPPSRSVAPDAARTAASEAPGTGPALAPLASDAATSGVQVPAPADTAAPAPAAEPSTASLSLATPLPESNAPAGQRATRSSFLAADESAPGPSAAGQGPSPGSHRPARGVSQRVQSLSSASTTGPDLPAPRKELPSQPSRGPQSSSEPRRESLARETAPSVTPNASSTISGLRDAALTTRAATDSESAQAEARNLRGGMPTETRPAGVADRVTLQVQDDDGRETRIRVAVRGDQVRAVIQPPDAEAARQLSGRMEDLQAALTKQGFVDPKVTVQAASGGSDRLGVVAAGAPVSTTPTTSTSSRGREQPSGDQRQGTGQQGQERGSGRQHSRHESPKRDPMDRGR